MGAVLLALPVRAQDRPVTAHPVRSREQQAEQELKTERDRPHKKERARAAVGRVEDGVREFGRGLQGVMKEAGIGDGPPARKSPAAKPTDKPRASKASNTADRPGPAPRATSPAK
jgi:hypothetical protein